MQSAHKDSGSDGQVSILDSNDSRLPNVHHLELDSGDSSDTEENGPRPSSPESVFSACSGRSHATYRPKGWASEPWVVAPPPCFTGSQLGSSEPMASSPLENLLIEHPSMSVYYSVPSSALPSTHPLFSLPHIADPSTEKEAGQTSGSESVRRTAEGAVDVSGSTTRLAEVPAASRLSSVQVQRRLHPRHAALHSIQLTPEKLEVKTRIAQRHQVSQSQKSLSKKDCYRSNMVRAYSASSKRNHRRDKLVRPSGCKSSRISQRLH